MSVIRVPTAWWVGEAIQDRTSSVMAVTAGLGSGKTHGQCQWHHQRVRDNAGARFSAFMQPTYQKVMDTAIPTYQKVLQAYGRIEGFHYRVVKSPFWKIVYLDQYPHHEVHFISADRPELIAGVEYSHASEDEAGVNKVQARRNLRGRLFRDRTVKVPQFLVSGAPQGITEFAEEFDSETIAGWVRDHPRDHYRIDYVEGVAIRKRRFILWTDDNPFVRPEYIAELMSTYGHNPMLIQAYRYGRFCPLTENVAFANYAPQRDDLDDIEPNEYRDIDLTFDFNANPVAWVAVQAVPFDEYGGRIIRRVAIHDAEEGSSNIEDALIEFRVKHPPARFRDTLIRVWGDRTGHAESHKNPLTDYQVIIKTLNELGYRNVELRAPNQIAPEKASVDSVNKAFSKGMLLICKRCKALRKSLQATAWKKGVRKLEKKAGETHTHHGDALKYFVYWNRELIYGSGAIIHGKN